MRYLALAIFDQVSEDPFPNRTLSPAHKALLDVLVLSVALEQIAYRAPERNSQSIVVE